MTGTARYLYAISRGIDTAGLAGVTGIDGQPVEAVDQGGLMALVSDVSLDEYGEEELRHNLEQLDWLEKVARGHDAVVQMVAGLGPTAPMRLATICLDDSGVRARLDEWHDELQEVLDRVDGCLEWSVKVFATESEEPAEKEERPTTGTDYLRSKKAAAATLAAAQEASLKTGEEIHAELSRGTVASRRLAPQDPRLSGRTGTMLLNGAYLVPRAETASFEDVVRRAAAEHPAVSVERGGPWPPYSFATLEQA